MTTTTDNNGDRMAFFPGGGWSRFGNSTIGQFGHRNDSWPPALGGQESSEIADRFALVRLALCCVYSVISLGFLSNVAVAVVVANIFARLGGQLPNRHMLVYILALCVADALVLGTLPLLVVQFYYQRWIFGATMCTVYWTVDSINKTLSTFILTCLSFDRYLAVRFPQRCLNIRTVRGALCILAGCVVLAALLLMPIYSRTGVSNDNDSDLTNDTVTCAFMGKPQYVLSIFLLCYVVPLACMVCFYGSMLARLRQKSRKLGLRQGRVRRVTKKTVVLVISYFVFFTPYWLMTVHGIINDEQSDEQYQQQRYQQHQQQQQQQQQQQNHQSSPDGTVDGASTTASADSSFGNEQDNDYMLAIHYAVMCIIHSGCYLNSAINPILYAILNRELRRQHCAAMNVGNRCALQVGRLSAAPRRTMDCSNAMPEIETDLCTWPLENYHVQQPPRRPTALTNGHCRPADGQQKLRACWPICGRRRKWTTTTAVAVAATDDELNTKEESPDDVRGLTVVTNGQAGAHRPLRDGRLGWSRQLRLLLEFLRFHHRKSQSRVL